MIKQNRDDAAGHQLARWSGQRGLTVEWVYPGRGQRVAGDKSAAPPRQPGFCAARAKARGLQALLWSSAPADSGGQDVTDADHALEAAAL